MKKLIALFSAVLMLAGLFCVPVSAGANDGFNDVELWWPCDHAYSNACDAECNLCGRLREVEHTYDNDEDIQCNLCEVYRIVITKAPKTGYAKMGEKVSVKVTALGDGLTYTWRLKNSGASKYSSSSVTKATYSTTMSAKAKDRLVFCYVRDAHGNEVKTDTIRLREAVSITKESATAAYAQMGKKVSVKVTASGDGLKYTWYIKNEGASKYSKSSITSATYSATMSSKVKNRRAYCVVTDKYGKKVQSKTFLLREGVSITSEPATATYVKNGATAKVTIKASGDGLKYTWYIKNASGTKYSKSSITSSTYSVKMSNSVNGRRIYCVVTDKYGNKVQSKTMILKKK